MVTALLGGAPRVVVVVVVVVIVVVAQHRLAIHTVDGLKRLGDTVGP